MKLTATQQTELTNLKAHFPYRIIYAQIDKDTGEFFAAAVTNMRIPNKLAREGHLVFVV